MAGSVHAAGGAWPARTEDFDGPLDISPVLTAARTVFGPRFGGAWHTEERPQQFVIAAVKPTDAEVIDLRACLGGNTSWLDVVGVKYSADELERFRQDVDAVFRAARPIKSAGFGPNSSGNCILVELNPEDADRLVPLLTSAIPVGALRIKIGSFEARTLNA